MPEFVIPKVGPSADSAVAWSHANARVSREIDALDDKKTWRVTIEEKKPGRSLSQNRMLWALYTDILRLGGETMAGWTKEDLHTFFLQDHFGSEVLDIFGKKRQVPLRRSSKLSKAEFVEFCDHIIRFMAERGVPLSDPHSKW